LSYFANNNVIHVITGEPICSASFATAEQTTALDLKHSLQFKLMLFCAQVRFNDPAPLYFTFLPGLAACNLVTTCCLLLLHVQIVFISIKVARQVYGDFRTAGTGLYFHQGLKMTESTTATVAKALFGITRVSQNTNF
jgi:hypothetical protein